MCLPSLSCLNKIGPLEVTKVRKDKIKRRGLSKTIPNNDPKMSIALLKGKYNFCEVLNLYAGMVNAVRDNLVMDYIDKKQLFKWKMVGKGKN